MAEDGDKPKKAHKKKTAGRKVKKKKDAQKVDRHNPKAHTFSGGNISVQKRVQHTMNKLANKERAPRIDKTPKVAPPFIVVVQGPPGVGKSTLVKSLVRHYCKQRLIQMRGPVTVVSGRHRRITIVECPQDIPAMLDLAKVADLVLLLIDASYGFELETFEFINILQVHGFPRVVGVLTHLDGFKENKQLKKIKKTMKHRFWSELYDGAKLFYMSGLQYGRDYFNRDVQNLARYIAVQKGRILSWRQSHPYMLALRWEDQTPPAEPQHAPRTLDLYGYVYGARLREGSQCHVPGVGDFHISTVRSLPDPCPPPEVVEAERRKAKGDARLSNVKSKKQNNLRTLQERHRVVYAPGSDMGSISLDSDAMYIHVPEHDVGFTRREGEEDEDENEEKKKELPEAVRLVRELQVGKGSLDRAGAQGDELQLISGSKLSITAGSNAASSRQRRPVPEGFSLKDFAGDGGHPDHTGDGDNEAEDSEEGEEEDKDEDEDEAADNPEGKGGEEEGDEEGGVRQLMHEQAKVRFERPPRLEEVIYGGLPYVTDKNSNKTSQNRDNVATDHATIPLFEDGDNDEDAEAEADEASVNGLLGNLGQINGLDVTRMPILPGQNTVWDEWSEEMKDALKERKFITGGWSSAEEEESDAEQPKQPVDTAEGGEGVGSGPGASGEASGLKAMEADPEAVAEFTDGVQIGTFARIRLVGVPAVCVAELRREKPLILGGLMAGEGGLGMVQARVKRHRWHPKLLKSNDALLLSVGWRRFQTLPTFSIEDRGEKRMRFLKYTLEHAHCTMTSYSPMMPPNTGIMAFRSWNRTTHFRVSATGVVLESAPNFEVKKKLKLVGEPYKIFKNTAFVKNMFSSDLEVNKYMYAKLQTTSGIRGELKKAEGQKGSFRATFEDRILMSDLVMCKCWVPVEPRKFYHPVIDVAGWRRARLIGELRADQGVAVPHNPDSNYGPQIVRPERAFNPLRIPTSLQRALPFAAKTRLEAKRPQGPFASETAIIPSEREKAINHLLNKLRVVREERMQLRKETSDKKKAIKAKQAEFVQKLRAGHEKENRKKRHIKEGQAEKSKRKALRLE